MPSAPNLQVPQEPSLRDLVKSVAGFSWVMSLFGVRSMGALMAPGPAAASIDSVTRATEEQLGGLRGIFRAGDRLQRTAIDMMLGLGAGAPPGAPPSAPGAPAPGPFAAGPAGGAPAGGVPAAGPPPRPVNPGRLDKSAFVALGEGLAAGASDFFLSEELQRESFPAQMARQMQTPFSLPLLQAPGIGNLPGFQRLPVQLPALMQTTVLEPFPGVAAPGNLAVPGFRLSDALHYRPEPPLAHGRDAVRSACNLILGMPGIIRDGGGEGPFPTQLEAALVRRPRLVLVELGYLEAIEAAVAGDPALLPDTARFRADLARLVEALRAAGAEVVVMNVPDPLDTAYVSDLETAARIVKVPAAVLREVYGLSDGDLLTPRGLIEAGFQFLSRSPGTLPAGSVLRLDAARRIGGRVGELNGALADVVRENGGHVCDLHALFRGVRAQGVQTAGRRLTADYLGGFYSLNGYYPGKTGHALIANQALDLLNRTYGADFPRIDLDAAAATDPVVLYQPAEGPDLPVGQMPPPPAALPAPEPIPPPRRATPARPAAGPWPPPAAAPKPLELPPGLEQVLPLNKERSYFGDALRAVDCPDPRAAQWGGCGGVLFGGLGLVDSHLSGEVRIRFSPPATLYGMQVANFEVSVGNGLAGDDGTLAAPQLYKLPAQQQRVTDFPGLVSSGIVDLATGLAIDGTVKVSFQFQNTALFALIRVNPHFPQVPIQFPGQYGTALAKFTQRPDGKLDFDFYGSTFLPLGSDLGGLPVRFPLPFAGASFQFASIPTRGLALHPHIRLSTREEPVEARGEVAAIPTNTVREYTFNTHNTSFGDDFHLNSPVLGGMARGRSQLVGRLHVQFGERAGDSVPIFVSAMNPGGSLQPMDPSPISMGFEQVAPGGRLSPGPYGFNETLRFPLRSYGLDDVFLLSDPFDLSVAAVDVRSGETLGDQVHRGFIGQNLFFALIRVEPRTPQGSFYFAGPAIFQKTRSGETVYRYLGEVHIPYPEGFLFPEPNLAQGFPAGPDSALDPFFWIQAMDGEPVPPETVKRGSAGEVLASTGDRFSYEYEIPADPARHRPRFEYTNHSQLGSFRLHSLTWARFLNARTTRNKPGEYDVVVFSGFGTWSKNGDFFQPASVVISTAPDAHYVGIQIGDGGGVSNVNTKPANPQDVEP